MIGIDRTPYAVAARVGLRSDGDVDWRKAEVISHERRGDYAVVLAVSDSYSWKYWHLHLLLRCLGGEWFPVNQASNSRWIPYDDGSPLGVAMQFDDSVCETNQRVRFRYGDREGNVTVNAGYLCVVRWDVDPADLDHSLEFLEVKVGKRWVPCVTSEVAATAMQFADAYLSLGTTDSSKHVWADSALRDKFDWEYRYKLVMAVIRYARLPQDKNALGMLGAGPLEDMMSDWLLDRLEPHLPFEAPLRYALSYVRMDFEPDALQERLKRMLMA